MSVADLIQGAGRRPWARTKGSPLSANRLSDPSRGVLHLNETAAGASFLTRRPDMNQMTSPPLSREAWLAAAVAAENAVLRVMVKGYPEVATWLQRRAKQMRERAEAAS